jgi:hypothetical protein
MGRALIHEQGHFFEWSTVVDAPTSEAMEREEAIAYCWQRHHLTRCEAEERLDRAEATGTSALGGWLSKQAIAEYNRAGPDETHLPWPELLKLVGLCDSNSDPEGEKP